MWTTSCCGCGSSAVSTRPPAIVRSRTFSIDEWDCSRNRNPRRTAHEAALLEREQSHDQVERRREAGPVATPSIGLERRSLLKRCSSLLCGNHTAVRPSFGMVSRRRFPGTCAGYGGPFAVRYSTAERAAHSPFYPVDRTRKYVHSSRSRTLLPAVFGTVRFADVERRRFGTTHTRSYVGFEFKTNLDPGNYGTRAPIRIRLDRDSIVDVGRITRVQDRAMNVSGVQPGVDRDRSPRASLGWNENASTEFSSYKCPGNRTDSRL